MDDLDALLADLGGGGAPTPTAQLSARQRVPPVAACSNPKVHDDLNDLDSLMNELSSTSAPSPVPGPRPTSHRPAAVAAAPVASSGGLDDLDALLGDLAGWFSVCCVCVCVFVCLFFGDFVFQCVCFPLVFLSVNGFCLSRLVGVFRVTCCEFFIVFLQWAGVCTW
jgi:hypothetical protein